MGRFTIGISTRTNWDGVNDQHDGYYFRQFQAESLIGAIETALEKGGGMFSSEKPEERILGWTTSMAVKKTGKGNPGYILWDKEEKYHNISWMPYESHFAARNRDGVRKEDYEKFIEEIEGLGLDPTNAPRATF